MPLNEPIQIAELWQPRCALRFGVSPCTATTADGPKCYNCWGTCLDRANYDGSGSIAWRFVKPVQQFQPYYSESGEDIKTNAFPMLTGISSRSSKINVGSIRDGEKPLGVTGGVSITLKDAPFDDFVGDYYKADRTFSGGNFWGKWTARNPFFANMYLRIYEGTSDQTIAQMTERLFVLDNVAGPNSDGSVTLTGVDPLRLTDNARAQFPRETNIQLNGAITDTATSISIIATEEVDLSDAFGNTATDYIIIGSEIIGYTGYSGGTDNVWSLSGVVRGQLGTTAASHSDGDGVQRVGRYDTMDAWAIANDMLVNHTEIPASFINYTNWTTEAVAYLTGYSFSRTVTKPTAVNALLGELMRDGTFYIWWDEENQTIPLKAMRPEITQHSITDNGQIVAGSLSMRREPDERISRIFVYFDQVDPTKSDDPTNFRTMQGRVNADVENADAGAELRSKTIYSKWITTDAQAVELTQRMLDRYGYSPRYMSVRMIDTTLEIGQIVNVTSRVDIDTEGREKTLRWQIISAQDVKAGECVEYQLQEFLYQATRYGFWTADAEVDYASATDEDRYYGKAWYSDADGLMPDGVTGYLWQ